MSQNLLHGSKELHVTPNKNIFSVLMILTPRLENQAYRLTHLQDHLKMSEFSSVEDKHSQNLNYKIWLFLEIQDIKYCSNVGI